MQYVLTSYVPGEDEEIVSDCMDFNKARGIFAKSLKMPEDEIDVKEGKALCIVTPDGEEVTMRPAYPDEMVFTDAEGIGRLDDIVAEFSDEKLKLAFDRAVADLGGGVVSDYEDEEFVKSYTDHLKRIAARDMMSSLMDQEKVEVCGIDDNGEIRHQAVV